MEINLGKEARPVAQAACSSPREAMSETLALLEEGLEGATVFVSVSDETGEDIVRSLHSDEVPRSGVAAVDRHLRPVSRHPSVVVPIRLENEDPRIVALHASGRDPGRFTAEEHARLRAGARIVAFLLDRERSQAELDRRVEQSDLAAHAASTIGAVVRWITGAEEPRCALCSASLEVAGGDVAAVWEPDAAGDLRLVAHRGVDPQDEILSGRAATGAREAMADARSVFLPASQEGDVFGSCRGPVLFEPIVRDGRAVGVLSVGWDRPRAELTGDTARALAALAVEAGLAIDRVDRMRRLEQDALTDPVTGRHNRRALSVELEIRVNAAIDGSSPLTLVLLEIDGLRALRRRRGHEAGDRLLVETTQVWNEILEEREWIARDGENVFVLLLPGAGASHAFERVDALRRAMPRGRCSVAVAVHNGHESAPHLRRRADGALQVARRSGRQRVALAPN